MVGYYHIRLVFQKPRQRYPMIFREFDLSEGRMKEFEKQYNKREEIFVGKRWIKFEYIQEIEIRESPIPSSKYPSGSIFLSDDPSIYDVTRRFIKSPQIKEKVSGTSSKNIFIVHGHDIEPVRELVAMLKEFRLNPIVLHEQASGGLTLAEKLERYSENIRFAFVILTPDDIGCQKIEAENWRRELFEGFILNRPVLITPNVMKPFFEETLNTRARQNVIFEMGYFWGLLKRKSVCCLLKDNVEKPSDIEGIVYIPFKDSINECHEMIIKELKEARLI